MDVLISLFHRTLFLGLFEIKAYRTLEDFVNAEVPNILKGKAEDIDYSEITVNFHSVPRVLLPSVLRNSKGWLEKSMASLQDFLVNHEVDQIFDWANFTEQENDSRYHKYTVEATLDYILRHKRWDRQDFLSTYVGVYNSIAEFGREYFEENNSSSQWEEFLIPYFSYRELGKRIYEFYNLSQFTVSSLSQYRQKLRLPPEGRYTWYDETALKSGFIGDYQDYEDFEYKEDEEKEKQFQKYIHDNEWKVNMANLSQSDKGIKYIKDYYNGSYRALLKDPECPWDLEDLVDWKDFGRDILEDSGEFFYSESDISDEGIHVFREN